MTEVPIIYKPVHRFAPQIIDWVLYDRNLHHERVNQKVPRISWYSFNQCRRNKRLRQPRSQPTNRFEPDILNWESNAITTRPPPHNWFVFLSSKLPFNLCRRIQKASFFANEKRQPIHILPNTYSKSAQETLWKAVKYDESWQKNNVKNVVLASLLTF